MPLHPLAQRFAEVAEAYERARPGHPPAVATALVEALGLQRGDPVAGAPGWSTPRRLQRVRAIAGDQPVALDVNTQITLAARE